MFHILNCCHICKDVVSASGTTFDAPVHLLISLVSQPDPGPVIVRKTTVMGMALGGVFRRPLADKSRPYQRSPALKSRPIVSDLPRSWKRVPL